MDREQSKITPEQIEDELTALREIAAKQPEKCEECGKHAIEMRLTCEGRSWQCYGCAAMIGNAGIDYFRGKLINAPRMMRLIEAQAAEIGRLHGIIEFNGFKGEL